MTQQNPAHRPHDVDASGEPEEVQALVADTNETRAQMSGTLGEIGERLDPQRMVEQAKQTVRDQTVGRAEAAVESAQTTAKDASRSAMETVKQNPVAAAVTGAGLVWLWTHRSSGQSGGSQQSGSATQQARQSASQAADSVQHAASGTLHDGQQAASQAADKLQHVTQDAIQQGQHTAQQARSQVKRLHEQNPLAMGVVALGAGAAIGMLLPETRPEKQLLGPPAQEVAKQAEKAVDQAKESAEAVAESAKQGAKEEAKSQGLSS